MFLYESNAAWRQAHCVKGFKNEPCTPKQRCCKNQIAAEKIRSQKITEKIEGVSILNK